MTSNTVREDRLVVAPLLLLLESDIQANQGKLKPLSLFSLRKVEALVSDIEVDLNKPLSDDVYY